MRTDDDAMPQTIAVKESIMHPNYKRPAEYYDIAILRLEEEATYNAYVRPACLPVDLPDVGQNDKATSTNWGAVDWRKIIKTEIFKITKTQLLKRNTNDI